MAEGDITPIGIALDTSQLDAGVRRVSESFRQLNTIVQQNAAVVQRSGAASTDAFQRIQSGSQQAQATLAGFAAQTASASQATQAFGAAMAQGEIAARAFAASSQQAGATLKDFQGETQAAVAQLQALTAALTANAQAHATTQEATRQTTQSVGSLSSAGSALNGVLGAVGISLSVASLVALGKSILTVGVALENTRASLVATSGGAQQGAQTFGFLAQTSNRLGVNLLVMADSYKGLQAATRGTNLEGQQTEQIFTAVAQAIRVTGGTSQQLHSAILAVEQIISKGTVSAEELRRQLGNALPGAFQIAARAIGTTSEELGNMLRQGELLSTEFIPKFTRQLLQEFGPGVQKAAQTSGASFQRLGNEILLVKDTLAQEVLPFFARLAETAAGALRKTREGREVPLERARAGLTARQGNVATPEDVAALAKVNREIAEVQAGIERATNATFEIGRQSTIARFMERLDEAMAKRQALITQLSARDIGARGVQARESLDQPMDIMREQAEAQRQATEANNKYRDALQQTDKVLRELTANSTAFPAAFGRAVGTADERLTFLQNRAKILQQQLQELAELQTKRPSAAGLVPPAEQARGAALNAELGRANAAIEAIREEERAREEAAREAEQAREAATREAEQSAERDAKQTVDAFREQSENRQKALDGLRQLAAKYQETRAERDADRASILAATTAEDDLTRAEGEQLRQVIAAGAAMADKATILKEEAKLTADTYEAYQKATGALQRYQEQFNLADERGRITPEGRALTTAEKALAPLKGTERGAEAETILGRLAKEADPTFKRLKSLSDSFADSFLNNINRLASGGITSFKAFADSVVADMLRIAQQQILSPLLGQLFQLGLTAAGSYFSGAGGGIATSTAPTSEGLQVAGSFASGGDVDAGRPYLVGERGPELFVPSQSGTVLPHGSMAGGATVNVHVYGVQDAQSFVRSRGEIQRAIVQAYTQAQRAA